MNIWAIADLHLSFGVPNKEMDVFGDHWKHHAQTIAQSWKERIAPEDLVLVAGDLSWAMRMEEVQADLDWLHSLPGTKVMIRGNHDYWWQTLSKVRKALPPSIHVIQNDSFIIDNIAIGGARLWDTDEFSFGDIIEWRENPISSPASAGQPSDALAQQKKIFERELNRLEMSLKTLPQDSHIRIVMTHYPPLGHQLKPSRASELLEAYNVDICVFGHLHQVRQDLPLFGEARGVRYHLTSCDYLNFVPLKISVNSD